MLCEKCGKNNATVLYTQIINGQKSKLHICSACAAQESIFENFGSLLSFSPREEFSVKMCPVCSTTLSEFSKTGRLGCGECYKTFRKNADAMLKKIHGTSKHIAEKKEELPLKEEKPKSKIEALKDKLKAAIEEENFEEAARLRDTIREMEKGDEK